MTFVKIVNRKNRKFTISKKFLTVDSPAFPPSKPYCKSLGESKPKTFGKGPRKQFSLSIYDFMIWNRKRVPVRTPLRSGKLRFYDFYDCHYLDLCCHMAHMPWILLPESHQTLDPTKPWTLNFGSLDLRDWALEYCWIVKLEILNPKFWILNLYTLNPKT